MKQNMSHEFDQTVYVEEKIEGFSSIEFLSNTVSLELKLFGASCVDNTWSRRIQGLIFIIIMFLRFYGDSWQYFVAGKHGSSTAPFHIKILEDSCLQSKHFSSINVRLLQSVNCAQDL